MSTDKIIHTTDADFKKDVLDSEKPVLVDFWAPWCGPCKSIAPILDHIAESYADDLKIVKINVDDNKEVLGKLGIRGIPALFLYSKGEVISQKAGAVSQGALLDWLKNNSVLS